MLMSLSDSKRRGLRTAIDVLLSAAASGLILVLYNIFAEPDMTAAAFATLMGTLTPVLSVIKNSLEDKSHTSFLVSKQRPEPDPTTPDTAPATLVGADEPVAQGPLDDGPLWASHELAPPSGQVIFAEVPSGKVLVLVDPEDVDDADDVVGFTR